MNLGTCKYCAHNDPEVKKRKELQIQKDKQIARMRMDEETKNSMLKCPKCGGTLAKRKGPYGEFFGCDNFPKCRYTKKGI
ncbi:MAG: topoisomerase DNA-binding C4 zinc finger domain-containing protein [Lachnospiraceae bacterium]|nr:topoisomerase DNA-binding C4 zinc finger domain-containing protein [Lachnospiraceae bacterium]